MTEPIFYKPSPLQKIRDIKVGKDVFICDFVNLYECSIGEQTRIGPFVEIQQNARIGSRCKISSHTFICEGVSIEDEVFIGHGVMFINDPRPKAVNSEGKLTQKKDWKVHPITVKKGASIGSGAVILCDVTIGEKALVGAGAVVTKSVPAGAIVAGNPSRLIQKGFEKADSKNYGVQEEPGAG